MEPLLVIAALIALVWGAVFVLRGSLLVGCLTFLAVNACLGYYFFHVRVGPAELTLDRIALIVLAATYVFHWRFGWTTAKPHVRMDYAVWAFFTWLAVRTFTSDFRNLPTDMPSPVWHLIIGYASPLFLYWIVRQIPFDQRAVRLVQTFFVVFGVYLALTGLAEVSGQWWAVFPRHVADPDVGLHFGRARGPMVQAIVYGFFLSVCMACAWVQRSRWGVRGQAAMLGCTALFLMAIFFSYTRCVWMGAALALGLLAWLTLSQRVRTVLLSSVCVAGLLVVPAQWERLQSFSGGRSADASRDSASMRLSFAYVSWQMFKDHPLVGCGFGQYYREKDAYLVDRSTSLGLEHIRHEAHHNLFLSILVETGLVGLVLYLSVLGTWAVGAWRLLRAAPPNAWVRSQGLVMLAALAAYVPNALFQPMGHMNIAHMLFFFLGGINAGLQCYVAPAVISASARDRARKTYAQTPVVAQA